MLIIKPIITTNTDRAKIILTQSLLFMFFIIITVFLVIFFFSVGAQFDVSALPSVAAAAVVLALSYLCLKPVVYQMLLRGVSESPKLAWNLGFRLGQCSEFALLIAVVALESGRLSPAAHTLIQATTILTLLISSYLVVTRFPTPIASNDALRRD